MAANECVCAFQIVSDNQTDREEEMETSNNEIVQELDNLLHDPEGQLIDSKNILH